ncbi:MAG: hypothetical protein KJ905_00070 [Nanoarchaeota archaeon]|nr:hypothetical protein [Nanoarchaeota archaeon]MBU1501156.1 hypothetical protein [Nanoarchaeota archaeon]MBU2458836.1 hypothetical protein [Nanoarchaeota archaeon]
MHLKRQEIPNNWPVYRKGTKFIVRPSSDILRGIPLLVLMRDMMEIAQNRKEVKRAIHMKNVLINSKPVVDDKSSAMLFDVITIVPEKKSYRITLTKSGKIDFQEIKDSEAGMKISKIRDKKILKGKKIQLNLEDGNNFLSDIKCNTNDSVIVNLKDRKVEKCIPLAEKANALVFAGKHSGKLGVIKKIDKKNGVVEMDFQSGKEAISVLIKQMIITE